MNTRDAVRAALAAHRKREDQITAIVDMIESVVTSRTYATGIPGVGVEREDIAPGIMFWRNGAGSLVEIEIDTDAEDLQWD